MDVFLFPSRYEGFGMAMIEAQCSGLACVASDVVPEDTNADGRAVYLPLEAGDESWARALLAHEDVDRSQAWIPVSDQFDIKTVSRLQADLYRNGLK